MDRNDRARIIYRAEHLERATKPKGKRNGVLGYTGLTILRALLFKFAARPTPSYKAIKGATGYCMDTISTALKRLRAAGLIEVVPQGRRTLLGWRRTNNLYRFPAQARLPLHPGEQQIPTEIKKEARSVPVGSLAGIVLTRDQQAAMMRLPLPVLQVLMGVLHGQM